jgi:hypothetical protein
VVPKQLGGMDEPASLGLLHANGHRLLHRLRAPLEGRRWLEPCTR